MATIDDATRTMIRNLEDKTGRSLADWAALARGSGHEKHGHIVAWLKGEHGLGHGYANLVALESRGGQGGGVSNLRGSISPHHRSSPRRRDERCWKQGLIPTS